MMQRQRVVAVVDDEPTMRKSFSRLLRTAGYEARLHASGQEFLEACRHDPPDCAIIDCQMPGLSGLEVLQRLKRCGIQLPVAMFAANDDTELRCACKTLGAQFFLLKPADGATLLKTIRSMVEQSRSEACHNPKTG